jgi:putative methionine-R-sulfoxide reductase with GAF domain
METLAAALRGYAISAQPREVRARSGAEAIRQAGGYRWVGLYDVMEHEIAVIAWAGPAASTHPRFPRSQGLNGAAVASGRSVVVQDVSKDARYLLTLGDTRGEFIMPVSGRNGAIVGTIDVESAVVDAFSARDQALLEACARALLPLWEPAEGAGGPAKR